MLLLLLSRYREPLEKLRRRANDGVANRTTTKARLNLINLSRDRQDKTRQDTTLEEGSEKSRLINVVGRVENLFDKKGRLARE